jgi:CheY-like chemotaxis protein
MIMQSIGPQRAQREWTGAREGSEATGVGAWPAGALAEEDSASDRTTGRGGPPGGPFDPPSGGQVKHLLLVEDDRDLRELMSILLEDAGYAVTTASNGQEALAALRQAFPDLILLDLKMPVMNGFEFTRVFRAQHARRAPILVVTAADDPQRRATEAGADGWLGKPFDPEALLAAVKQHLAQSSPEPR